MPDENPMVKYLTAELVVIQKFMDENIGDGRKMTGADIFQGVKSQLSKEFSENTFKTSLSANVKAGNIKGFEGRRRVGYVKIGDEIESSTRPPEPEDNETDKFVIQITKSTRVVLLDRHNYAYQKFSGSMWVSKKYNSNLGKLLKSVTNEIINTTLATSNRRVNLSEAKDAFAQLEAVILGELIVRSDVNPDTKASEHYKVA